MPKRRRGRPAKVATTNAAVNKALGGLSATALQEKLWNTIEGVSNGDIKPIEANSINGLARGITDIAKTELQFIKVTKGSGNVPAGVNTLFLS